MFSLNSFAQQKGKRQVVYAELLGSGVVGSVNYDFRFKPGNDGFGMRMGLGYIPDAIIIPLEINGLLGKKRVAFEYGAGISSAIFLSNDYINEAFLEDIKNFGVIGYVKSGVRITPKKNGVFLNLNWYLVRNKYEYINWFGLGIGYSWNK